MTIYIHNVNILIKLTLHHVERHFAMSKFVGGNSSDLSERNRSMVLRILQQGEICSRADIARRTGLTNAAITKIIAGMVDIGLVSEVGYLKSAPKHRAVGLVLHSEKFQVLGVKFMRGMYALGVFDISGKCYAHQEFTFSNEIAPEIILAEMKQNIDEYIAQYPRIISIGVALPGPYGHKEGRVITMTDMPGWTKVNFNVFFNQSFDKPVFIEHDAHAGAMAEWLFGNYDERMDSLVYFLIGAGVGAGVIMNGKLFGGANGFACEIGHISIDVNGHVCECGNHGCLEQYCSASALLRKAKVRCPECFKKDNQATCEAIFTSARMGNQNALSILKEIATYIGYGCITLINAYNPSEIVIGDILSKAGDLLLPTIRQVVQSRLEKEIYDSVHIRMTNFKLDPTLYGAAAVATDKALQMPSIFLKAEQM